MRRDGHPDHTEDSTLPDLADLAELDALLSTTAPKRPKIGNGKAAIRMGSPQAEVPAPALLIQFDNGSPKVVNQIAEPEREPAKTVRSKIIATEAATALFAAKATAAPDMPEEGEIMSESEMNWADTAEAEEGQATYPTEPAEKPTWPTGTWEETWAPYVKVKQPCAAHINPTTRRGNLKDGLPAKGFGKMPSLSERLSEQKKKEQKRQKGRHPEYLGFMKYRLKTALKIGKYNPRTDTYSMYSTKDRQVSFQVSPEHITCELHGDEDGVVRYSSQPDARIVRQQATSIECQTETTTAATVHTQTCMNEIAHLRQENAKLREQTKSMHKAINSQKFIQAAQTTAEVRRAELVRLPNGIEREAFPKVTEILDDLSKELSREEREIYRCGGIFSTERGQLDSRLRTESLPDGRVIKTRSHGFDIPQPYE